MITSPENTIKRIYKHMTNQAWIAAIATIMSGYVAHLFILTNEFFNHDDIGAWLQEHSWKQPTRWLQGIFCYLVSPIGSGVMAGSLTILILSISSLLLVDTIKVKSKVFSVIIGIMMIVSPIVASFMSYLNGSYLFCIGIPFSILAVRWFERGWKGYVLSCISLMCSIAGYQSNIAITIALMYVVLFGRLLERNVDIKKWWKSFAKAFGILIIGIVLYVISNKIMVSVVGSGGFSGENGYSIGITTETLEKHGYEGQAETGKLYINEIPSTVKTAIKYYIKYNFNTFFGGANLSFASIINVISSVVLFICCGISIINIIIHQKKIINIVMIVAIAMMAPICLNSIEIILNGKCTESLQMMFSLIMTTPLVVIVQEKNIILENSIDGQSKWKKIREKLFGIIVNIVVIAFILHIYGNMQIVNDAYQRLNSEYETAYGELCRIIDRVEQLPEWQDGNRTLYFDYQKGYLINDNYQAFVQPYNSMIDMGWMGVFGTGVYSFWNNSNTSNLVKCYLGINFENPNDEQIEKIRESSEYNRLQQFPSTDSIKVIEDVIVVRMD